MVTSTKDVVIVEASAVVISDLLVPREVAVLASLLVSSLLVLLVSGLAELVLVIIELVVEGIVDDMESVMGDIELASEVMTFVVDDIVVTGGREED